MAMADYGNLRIACFPWPDPTAEAGHCYPMDSTWFHHGIHGMHGMRSPHAPHDVPRVPYFRGYNKKQINETVYPQVTMLLFTKTVIHDLDDLGCSHFRKPPYDTWWYILCKLINDDIVHRIPISPIYIHIIHMRTPLKPTGFDFLFCFTMLF